MKKIIYIALFLLTASYGYAQGYEARIRISSLGNQTYAFSGYTTYMAYNNATLVDSYAISNNTGQSQNPPQVVFLNATVPITRVTIAYRIAYHEGPNGTCTVATQTVNVTNVDCFSTTVSACRSFNVDVYALDFVDQPTNNSICLENPVSLQAVNNCNANNYNYSWYYTTDINNPFQTLGVQTVGSNSVQVDLSAFLAANYTGNVFIRAHVNGSFTNAITYNVISCTPDILSVATTPTSCSQNSDGSFTITFDEVLTNQQILFELRRDSFAGPIESSFTATVNGTTYLWPNPLVARSYYLEYQATPAGSVVQYSPITIASPSAIAFSAGWTDVDCFGDNTGSISINAAGGVGNFQYSINNGANWFAFSSAASHNVTNLPAGNYQVKVRDGNNCVAQN